MTANDATGAPPSATAGAAPRPVAEGDRRDRTRWGPIWAGALVVLTTYLVLQLFFFALGILDLSFDAGRSGTWPWAHILAAAFHRLAALPIPQT